MNTQYNNLDEAVWSLATMCFGKFIQELSFKSFASFVYTFGLSESNRVKTLLTLSQALFKWFLPKKKSFKFFLFIISISKFDWLIN